MREDGWLQDVFKEASKRVDQWPEWKKASEARRASVESQEPAPSKVEAKQVTNER
jgi:hypothetical protein